MVFLHFGDWSQDCDSIEGQASSESGQPGTSGSQGPQLYNVAIV